MREAERRKSGAGRSGAGRSGAEEEPGAEVHAPNDRHSAHRVGTREQAQHTCLRKPGMTVSAGVVVDDLDAHVALHLHVAGPVYNRGGATSKLPSKHVPPVEDGAHDQCGGQRSRNAAHGRQRGKDGRQRTRRRFHLVEAHALTQRALATLSTWPR